LCLWKDNDEDDKLRKWNVKYTSSKCLECLGWILIGSTYQLHSFPAISTLDIQQEKTLILLSQTIIFFWNIAKLAQVPAPAGLS
jgi:hypothetical protein